MAVDITVHSSLRAPVARRRIADYDRTLVRAACDIDLNDPNHDSTMAESVRLFEEYIKHMPTIFFEVDPTSHNYIVDEYIIEGLTRFFPKTRKPPKQCYLSLEALWFIGQKANLLHIRGKW